jgi:tetratricopeptide (TPR) repeat protein
MIVTVGIVVVALVTATAVSTWQAVVARDAQRQAEAAEGRAATEAAIARAVNDFLQGDLLGQAASAPQLGPDAAGNPYLTVREALNRAADRIGQRFQDQPLVEAAIRTTIGAAYNPLGEHRLAVPHLERALTLRCTYLGPDHPDIFGSMDYLATAYSWVGRHADAIALRQRILENQKAQLGPDHPETLACVCGLAEAYEVAGQWDTSIRLLEGLMEKQSTICGPAHPDTLETMHHQAMIYGNLNRLEESLALHEKTLELRKSTLGSEHVSTHWCMLSLAHVCQRAGKLDQANHVLREALEITRKGPDSWKRLFQRANTLGDFALNLTLQKKYAEAEPLVREAVAIYERHRPEGPRRFYLVNLMGAVLLGQQKYAAAEHLLLQGYEGMEQREAVIFAHERRLLFEASERVVRFYEATNQPEKARAWREKVKPRLPDAAAVGVK